MGWGNGWVSHFLPRHSLRASVPPLSFPLSLLLFLDPKEAKGMSEETSEWREAEEG